MKVILLKDVAGVGVRNAVKEVADGYALNFLIPRKFAEQATEVKIATLEARSKENTENAMAQDAVWAKEIARLQGAKVVVAAKANEQGHLYHQLPVALIAEGIKDEYEVSVPLDAILLKEPIKKVGESEGEVHLGAHRTKITVSVIATK